MASPTSRTLEWLRDNGYICEVVEHWNPHTKQRKDLFGFVDIVAIRGGETLYVQATSTSNVQSRIKKIRDNPIARVMLENDIPILVIGWKKYAKAVNRRYWQPTTLYLHRDYEGAVPGVCKSG